MARPKREVRPPPLSTSSCASSSERCKVAPAAPTGVRWVKPHDGSRDPKGRLKPFPSAPKHFLPNLTPREMLLKGMHGGIYFNPKGGKPGVKYPRSRYPNGIPGVGVDEFPREWFEGVPKELYLSRKYDVKHNCYGVKSGLDQVGWETSGWINPCDPRGWTQWYFRFFMGRRLDGGEDERQISRWNGVAGEKGRWKSNLIGKCMRDSKAYDDPSVSPVVRQTLLHWAYELKESDFLKGAKRVEKVGAAYLPHHEMLHVYRKARGEKREVAGSGEATGDVQVQPTDGESTRAKRARKRAGEADEACQ